MGVLKTRHFMTHSMMPRSMMAHLAPQKLLTWTLASLCLSVGASCDDPDFHDRRRATLTAEAFWRVALAVDGRGLERQMTEKLTASVGRYGDLICRAKNGLCGVPRVSTELCGAFSMVMGSDGELVEGLGVRCEFKDKPVRQAFKDGTETRRLRGSCRFFPLTVQSDEAIPKEDPKRAIRATMDMVEVNDRTRRLWKIHSFVVHFPGEDFVFSPDNVSRKTVNTGQISL